MPGPEYFWLDVITLAPSGESTTDVLRSAAKMQSGPVSVTPDPTPVAL